MKNITLSIFTVLLVLIGNYTSIAQNILSPEIQIKLAVMAAPPELQDSATILGYNESHELIVLRQGTNDMICLADDPSVPGLNVACYQKDLEPFMARGRALRAEGKNMEAIMKIRENEVQEGKLTMPKNPATLYVYSAKPDDFNVTTGEVKNGYLRYVIYVPYATAESTGLALKPSAPGMPWLMDPGTHRAHIMINPPHQKKPEEKK